MNEPIDAEIDAIRSVLKALEPLKPDVRATVVTYVLSRLQIPLARGTPPTIVPAQLVAPTEATPASSASLSGGEVMHIKDLKELKKPRSANEMAALVAYYLEEVAPPKDRKKAITAKDLETYFKIAQYPLTQIKFTLPNAKAAGYLDAVGNGAYQLNAVGHNLVVHSMPRDTSGATKSPRKAPGKKVKSATRTRSSKKQ